MDQKFAIIHPARKAGEPYEDFCPKAVVDVELSANGLQTQFSCFPDPDNCKSTACVGNYESVMSEDVAEVQLSLCVADTDPNTAAIWEINISEVRWKYLKTTYNTSHHIKLLFQANESSKIQGIFMDDARERFQLTQTIPDFNKQITIVSIVGGRGVGKSTVSSLLSGNHSMFTTGSGSVGTTTTGADISTIIPTTDYADILGSQLGIGLNEVKK